MLSSSGLRRDYLTHAICCGELMSALGHICRSVADGGDTATAARPDPWQLTNLSQGHC
jgi:hypothetical protein